MDALTMPVLSKDQTESLSRFAAALAAAPHGGKAAIEAEAKRLYGWSRDTFYRNLKAIGWQSGRKPRADKGSSSVPLESLVAVGAMMNEGMRENGKQTLKTPTTRSVALVNGIHLPVGTRQLNRLLKSQRLDVKSQKKADPVQALRALHPNHVHEVDPSLCLLFYMGGKQRMVRDSQFYKNKLDAFVKNVKLKVWRYVCYDRASAAILFRYYEAAGENQANLFEFLHWAWSQKSQDIAIHGVPQIMLWDKGSANTAKSVTRWLEAMDVRAMTHEAGNARAKGGVENGNNVVETMFESRLRFEPVNNVEELNAAAERFCAAFNANRLPYMDVRLKRPGMQPSARLDLWLKIKPNELRLPPSIEICRELMAGGDVTREVSTELSISYKHPQAHCSRIYRLEHITQLCAGDKVMLRPLVFGDCAIQLILSHVDGSERLVRVEPNDAIDEFGQQLSAAIVGEDYKAKPDTAIEHAAKVMESIAYPNTDAKLARDKGVTPFDGKLNALSHLNDIEHPAILPRRGVEIAVQASKFAVKPMSITEAAKTLIARGIERADLYMWLKTRYPNGLMPEELEAAHSQLIEKPTLKVVLGGA